MAALCLPLMLAGAPARAGTVRVDGISDQSLPAWDGGFAASPLAAQLGDVLAGGGRGQIGLARYVVQWNALTQPSRGPSPAGDYRERFEAWLVDVRRLGMTAVVALTSYDGAYPGSPGEYARTLRGVLDAGLAQGEPIAYLEPWNEPNNQGRMGAGAAALLADVANAICRTRGDCQVIAGDFEDTPELPSYERSYERALTFTPALWGVHPYRAVAAHSEATVRAFLAALPDGGLGARVWLTEVAVFYCRHGQVLGEPSQAADAAYLLHGLIGDPAVAPEHVLYYGLMAGDGRPAQCAAGGGDDSELYAPGDRPRAAAEVLLPAIAHRFGWPAFGPGPAAE